MTVLETQVEHIGPGWLRRCAQTAVMGQRGISNADVARQIGVSRELISKYFQGSHPMNKLGTNDARVEEFEDTVELAIEACSREIGFELPPVQVRITGPVDETGLPDFEFIDPFVQAAMTKELMSA